MCRIARIAISRLSPRYNISCRRERHQYNAKTLSVNPRLSDRMLSRNNIQLNIFTLPSPLHNVNIRRQRFSVSFCKRRWSPLEFNSRFANIWTRAMKSETTRIPFYVTFSPPSSPYLLKLPIIIAKNYCNLYRTDTYSSYKYYTHKRWYILNSPIKTLKCTLLYALRHIYMRKEKLCGDDREGPSLRPALSVLFLFSAPPPERNGELARGLRRSYYGKWGLIDKVVREGFYDLLGGRRTEQGASK